MKIYQGKKVGYQKEVTVDGSTLQLRNHPIHFDDFPKFSWSDQSPGSKNLAYSIIADAIGEDNALFYCDDFLESVVSKLNHDQWKLTDKDVTEFCDHLAGIRSTIPTDGWTDAGSGPTSVVTIPITLPKIASNPNYHADEDKKK